MGKVHLTMTEGARKGATLLLLCFALMTGIRSARAEDRAIVIGINRYPNLRKGSDLHGCVNDAHQMRSRLEKLGFKVLELTDRKARRQDITAAIDQTKHLTKRSDRLVVFFAGYGAGGTRKGMVLLPSDAQDGSDTNDLSLGELYQRLQEVPAQNKTVVLDSCYSGAMLAKAEAAQQERGGLRPRLYLRSSQINGASRTWQTVSADQADQMDRTIAEGSICFVTAALRTQLAHETEIKGEPRGVFSYYLCDELGKDIHNLSWQEVQADVGAQVARATASEQQPLLVPNKYLKRFVFSDDSPESVTLSLAQIYKLASPDPFKIAVRMEPALSPVKVGDRVRFKALVGKEGYLLLVNRDPGNKVSLLFPAGSDVEEAHVTAGATIFVPADPTAALAPDTPGTDGVKAFLFARKETAAAFLAALHEGLTTNELLARLQNVSAKDAEFYTSELITLIVNR